MSIKTLTFWPFFCKYRLRTKPNIDSEVDLPCVSTAEWEGVLTVGSSVKVDSSFLCALQCNRRGEECGAWHYHHQTGLCNLAGVSCTVVVWSL